MDDSLLVSLIYKHFSEKNVDVNAAWKTIATFTGLKENICKKRWSYIKDKYEKIKLGKERGEGWELLDLMNSYDKLKENINSDDSGESEDEGEEEEVEQHIPVNNLKQPKKKQLVVKSPAVKPPVANVQTPAQMVTATPRKRKLENPSAQSTAKKLDIVKQEATNRTNFVEQKFNPRLSRRVDVAFGKYIGFEMTQIYDPNNTIKPAIRKKIQQLVHDEIQNSLKVKF